MAQDISGGRILSITIIPRRLGKESKRLGIDKDEWVKRLGIKAERLGIKLGKSKVEILWMMYQNPTEL